MRGRRLYFSSLLAAVLLIGIPPLALATKDVGTKLDDGGASAQIVNQQSPPRWKGDDGKHPKPSAADLVEYKYDVVPACEANNPNKNRVDNVSCMRSVQGCRPAEGPLYEIYQLTLTGGAPTGPWRMIGTVCGSPGWITPRPAVTMPMIESEFKKIAWAKLGAKIQPPKGVTLVNLKTYFEASWQVAGFQPDETATVSLLGNTVDIRPVLVGYTYVYGDGSSFGPTLDPGGDWKTGSIFHVYQDPGSYRPRIDATVTADFRINGGPWDRVPAEATITGVPSPLRVATAHPVLIR